MKKIGFITMMILLLVNSFLTPIAANANSNNEQLFILGTPEIIKGSEEESTATVKYNWHFNAGDKKEAAVFDFQLPEGVKVGTSQTNKLLIDGTEIGSYTVSGNQIQVKILQNQTKSGSGTIEIVGEQEITVNQPEADSTVTGDSTEEAVENTKVENGKKVELLKEVDGITSEEDGKSTTEENGTDDSKGKEENNKTTNTDIKDNILTSAKLTFENKEGQEIESVDRESIITVDYEYVLPNNHGYTDGAIFKFNLPKELIVYEEVKNAPLRFDGEDIGVFSVGMDGVATVTFNKFIENHSDIKGTLQVLSKISEKVVVTDEKIVTVTPITGKDSIDIPINYNPNGTAIDKKGTPDKNYNAKTINWTIDFNKNLDSIKNAKLSDPIQEGQLLQANSIKVYKLITHLDGSVEQGEEVTTGFNVGKITGDKDFQIDLGDIKSAYRVEYTTDIIDSDGTKYQNEATLSGTDFNEQSASATVSVGRGKTLEKNQ